MFDFLFDLQFWINAVISIVVMVGLMTGMAYMTWFERRVISKMQVRIGPNRVGFFGLLQPLADGLKLMSKEDILPSSADKVLFRLAPAMSLFAALAAFAVMPVWDGAKVGEYKIPDVIADLSVSVLYIVSVSSLGVYGIVLGGWSSGSKYSLLGSLRGAAQVVSYELIVSTALVAVAMVTDSLSLKDIVAYQRDHVSLIFVLPVAFVLYLVGAFAEVNRAPFDLPEAETELVAGYHTEYSGFRFAMFYIAEYVNMITVSILATTLFLGGWNGPFGLLPGPHWLLLKMVFFLFLFVWVRATIPRLRYDQLMRLSWSYLLPIGLINLAVYAVLVALGVF